MPLVPQPYCPFCTKLIDGYTPIGGRQHPKPGDVSLCYYCSALLVFDGDPALPRAPTPAEITDILGTPELVRGLGIAGLVVQGQTLTGNGPRMQ
jgi:hypothetical protein